MDQVPCGEDGCSELASHVGNVETGSVDTDTMRQVPTRHRDLYQCPAGHATWVTKPV